MGLPDNSQRINRRLVVFTSVGHHKVNGVWIAHGGFVREINLWARIFQEVLVIGLWSDLPPLSDAIPYTGTNISFVGLDPVFYSGNLLGKLKLLAAAPRRVFIAAKCLTPTCVAMARGPDSIGFLGVILTRSNRLLRFAKYAGQWEKYPGEPLGYKIQRLVYRSRYFGGPVIVNASPDHRRPHVVPLFNASISRHEWAEAGQKVKTRQFAPPYRLLFVGRLTPAKGLDILLRAFQKVIYQGKSVMLDIVGEGGERNHLETLSQELNIVNQVTFHGWKSREDLTDFYSNAFCFVHPVRHQGLDKVLLEAMTYALPIIGTNVSVSPLIVAPPRCGLLVKPEDPDAFAEAIITVLDQPELAKEMGVAGYNQAQNYLLDDQESKFRNFLKNHLGLEISG
jgi:glycosyltransferase involved in cell wall biosynthesis